MPQIDSINDVPNIVKEIVPARIAFPLSPYSTQGELFSRTEQEEQFVLATSRFLSGIPRGDLPHVVSFNFNGITRFSTEAAINTLGFAVLGNFKGNYSPDQHPAFAIFDQLEARAMRNLRNTLIRNSRHSLVLVARQQSSPTWELVGKDEAVRKYNRAFEALTRRGGWVNALPFARQDLGLTEIRLLDEMAKKALIIKSGRSYYRSLV